MVNKKSKKIFLIFVEGTTDEDCLDVIVDQFNKQLNDANITIRVQHGDIFTKRENYTKSGKNILKEQVSRYIDYSKVTPSQIEHVAFITDTDGIFINPVNYVTDSRIDSVDYDFQTKRVICKNEDKKNEIIETRQRKSRKIASLNKNKDDSTIVMDRTSIPYSLYFNSVNLEHVLFDKTLPDKDKTAAIDELLDEIDEDPNKLIDIFQTKAIGSNYYESWEKIKDCELERGYTNLHILFKLLEDLN